MAENIILDIISVISVTESMRNYPEHVLHRTCEDGERMSLQLGKVQDEVCLEN